LQALTGEEGFPVDWRGEELLQIVSGYGAFRSGENTPRYRFDELPPWAVSSPVALAAA
jgi:hypothetical protein